MEERLQKIMSAAGVASRRKAEEMIVEGRVRVNGVTVRELGTKADPLRDEIRVDGKQISTELEHTYIMLHKPEGYVTTTKDPEGRPTVMDLVKRVKRRVYPVGRLDWATSGLLLFTSDGDLTRFLTHPSSKIPKTYYVKLEGRIADAALKKLEAGPDIGGRPLKPSRASFVKFSRGRTHSWIEMTISEGRTRQIRLMGEAIGHPVLKLKRTALGPLLLADLPLGEWRFLTEREVAALKRLMKKKS
ncbi:MAG TPA: pseudouridine synthase [bacterium]|nr:pseudouridine synthase [bacterium]